MDNRKAITLKGKFKAELIRNGKVVGTFNGKNGTTTAGLNKLLDVMFHGTIQIGTWYIGLINDTPTPTLLAADTLASHTGWSELTPTTDYTGSRPAWAEAAASSGATTSSSVSTFAILTTQTVYGIMVCSAASGTSGTLWATGAFDEVIPVVNGDEIKVTYTVEASEG